MTSASGPRAERLRSSRTWIATTGPRQRRTTTFSFVLRHNGRVVFTIDEVSPECEAVAHFTVAGHPGLNRVRFAGTVHHHRLAPGTYRISIRAASGRVVRRATLVVVDGAAPSQSELRSLRWANACSSATTTSPFGSTFPGTTLAPPLPPASTPPASSQQGAAEGLLAPRGPSLHGVLGSSVAKTARAIRPLLVALLGVAILLLGVASLPREAVPEPRMHDLLARHRVEVAGLGAATLVAVALAFLLS